MLSPGLQRQLDCGAIRIDAFKKHVKLGRNNLGKAFQHLQIIKYQIIGSLFVKSIHFQDVPVQDTHSVSIAKKKKKFQVH